ncbi:MAG: SIS domain-containing protein [Anaerolineae bacterium]|nr:SIS domain-containing protein [Anaerolineae bacterium]
MSEILIKEINEQPHIIQNLVDSEYSEIEKIAAKIQGKFNYAMIAARGTSDNAARYAQYILGAFNQIPVALATPSLYTVYKKPPKLVNALVIGISQSGVSPDIVAVLEHAKEQGQTTICITNEPDSPMGHLADYVIPLHCGKEQSVAASKTYSASLTALAMLSVALAGDQDRRNELAALPSKLANIIADANETNTRTCRYRYIEHCVVIGRGFNYCTAYEVALKVKELSRVVTVPYSSADFKHGPIAAVHTGFPVILVAPYGEMFDQMVEFADKMHDLGAELISISNRQEILKNSNLGFRIPSDIPEWISPIACALPGQLFARQLAFEKGLNIDSPVGLSKVTETF